MKCANIGAVSSFDLCDLLLLHLLQRSLLPGGIILQGVLLLQGSMSVFCVPLWLGANWGYWPSDSVFNHL
jgi:hypothetical protein